MEEEWEEEKKEGDGQAKNNYKDSAVELKNYFSIEKQLPTSTKRGTMMTGQAFVAQKKVKSQKVLQRDWWRDPF